MAHQFSCQDAGYDCDFFLEAGSVDELVHHVQDHTEREHDSHLTRADVQDHVVQVGR